MGSKLEEYGPRGRVPECGAIFMANRETKKECLKMEMFALPSGSANFVKQVKAGMLLFLFEYEKRQLFGVYRAATDGGINILSQGSRSSLTQYPAQVCFTPVWFCDPLSEKEFKDAIKENYFAGRKFNFGLSEDQVHKLLQLFSSRKSKNDLQPKQLRDSSEPSHDLRLKLSKKLDAENREVINGSPDLLSKDSTHSPNTFKQSGLPNTKRRKEDNDKHPMNLKDQQSVHHDVPGPNFCGEYSGDTLDGNKRTKVKDDGNSVKLKDQRSVHQDVPGINFRNKSRNEEEDGYLMNLKDQRSVYHDVPGLNFCGDTSESKKRRMEDGEMYSMNLKDEKIVHEDVSGINVYIPTLIGSESHGDLLDKRWQPSECDDEYFPVPINPRVASNDMYTFVDRAVADIEQDDRPSSNSPLIRSENFAFGAKGLSDDKSYMNLGSRRTYELCNSQQDEIAGDTKCSQPESHYPLNDTKYLTRDMQNMDEWKYRPHMNGQFDNEHYLDASHDQVTDDGLDLVRDGRVKAGHSGEPIWSSRSYIPSRRSSDTKHNQDEGSAAMGSFHNSVASFGYEDPSMYCEGSHPIKKNELSEAQHLFHTYPSYHESLVTESVPCDSDVNYSSSLLRGIPPYEGSKNQDKLQSSTSTSQDYYLGDTELGNILPTNRRSPLVATSPFANKCLAEDVFCSEEKNYDSECHVSQGQVMGQCNDNVQHPIDVSGIPKSNRRSVFARLSSGPDISSREKLDSDDTTVDELMGTLLEDVKPQLKKQGKGKSQKLGEHDEETPYSDRMLKAVDEVMSMLPQIKKSLVKMPDEEVPITEENLSLEYGHLMIDSFEDHANYLNIGDGECPDDTLRETRLVQFKRRSETKKNLGKKEVDKLLPFKRRKLVRPAFVVNESVAEGMETKPKMQDPVKDTP